MEEASSSEPGPVWLSARIAAVHSNHRRIASGALLIGALTLVAKLFVAAREMAIAWRFGVSSTVDSYQLAVTATTWLPNMLAGVMAVVLVPRLIQVRRQPGGREPFISELNASVLLLALVVALATWLGAPYAAALLASTTDPQTAQLTSVMIARMAPVAFFSIVVGYMFARLQAQERFGYSVSEALPALAIALFVIGPLGFGGTAALIDGTVLGYLLQFAALGVLILHGDPPLGSFRLRHRSGEWPSLYGSLLMMVSGQLLITASIPIDQGFAARLGEGAVASLGYANRIITLFSTLGTVVVGRALLPVLSGAAADHQFELGRRQAMQWAGLLGGTATIGSAAIWLFAPYIVHLLFERGAFGAAASTEVSKLLRWGLLQLPFFFAGVAMVQWYAAAGRYRAIFAITAVALFLKVASNFLLIPRFGVAGVMIATAIMYAVTFSLLLIWLPSPQRPDALSSPDVGR